MISRFFIERPVFSIVLSLVIVIAGLVSMAVLPIARYPEITPPQIRISAVYPGADAETVAESVAAPIEQQLSGIENMIYYSSQSSNDGSCTITVTFEIGTDQSLAAVDVQNRLSIAEPQLPQEVVRQGIPVVEASTNILALVSLKSENAAHDALYLSNYATINLLDRIKRVPGVGEALVFGGMDYSMRIWMNPDRLALKGMTVSDAAAALRDQNAVFPAGTVAQRPTSDNTELTLPVLTRGRLDEASEYEDIILRATPEGAIVRLSDVADVELGPESYNQFGKLDGRPTALMMIYLQVGANALSTMDAVRTELDAASQEFPTGVTWGVPYDTTTFIGASVQKVVVTLVEAFALVVVIVFVFLQSWRATLIPLLAVPVAIIGAFAGMLLLGFSINTLTLFGLVLAIGIVVDDAIVVVENVERIMDEEGLPPREATIKAMEQVTSALITIVLVLSAVFIPVAFLGGFTGQMYQQFAVTIAVSVAISGLVAITLSPALCPLLLKPSHGKRKNFLFRAFNRGFDWITGRYVACVRLSIRGPVVTLLIYGALCFGVYRMSNVVPSGFLPEEDQGTIMASVLLPDGASLDQTERVMDRAEDFFSSHPAVDNVVALGGFDLLAGGSPATNAGALFVSLKPFAQRMNPELSAQAVIADSRILDTKIREGIVLVMNPPPIQGLGTRSGFTAQLQQRGGGTITELADAGNGFLAALRQTEEVTGLNATLRVSLPQVFVAINRAKTQMLGVNLAAAFEPLQAYFGSLYINDFYRFGRVWRVNLMAQAPFRDEPRDIEDIFVRNNTGQMVPLSAIVDRSFRVGPNGVSRFNGYPAIEITGIPAPGGSEGQSVATIRELAASELPPSYGIDWSGATYQQIKAGNQAPIVMAFGLLMVYLILAAQYERWGLPVAVLLAVPPALLGALVGLWLRDYSQDIYFQIGVLTLIGLAAKNAILIVEFSVALREQGRGIGESALEAAKLRLRPIIMTSLAFILGVVPLAVATGASAASQRSLGTTVVFGMLGATFVAILFVPLFYVLVQRVTEFISGRRGTPVESSAHSRG